MIWLMSNMFEIFMYIWLYGNMVIWKLYGNIEIWLYGYLEIYVYMVEIGMYYFVI